MVLILPSVAQQPERSVPFAAPGVVPVQNQAGGQIQQLGQATQQLGGAVMTVGNRIQNYADNAAIKRAMNAYSDSTRQTLQDFRGLTGKAAMDAREDAMEKVRAVRPAIEQNLTEEQLQAFQLEADARQSDIFAAMDDHAQRASRAYDIGETVARANSALGDAAMFALSGGDPQEPGKPSRAAVYAGIGIKAVHEHADLLGLPQDSEQRKAMVLEATTGLHEAIIRGLVEQDPMGAKGYLAANRAEIEPDKAQALDRLVRTSSVHAMGDELARSIQGKGDLREQIAQVEARADLPVEVRDNAKQRIQQADAIAYQTEQRGAARVLSDLENWSRLNPQDPNQVGPASVPPPQLIEDARKYGVLDDYAVWLKNGGQWSTTDRGTNLLLTLPDSALEGLPSAQDVVRTFRSELGDDDLGRMVSRWQKLQAKPSPEALLASEVENIVNAEARAAGVLPEAYREKDLTPAQTAAYQKWDIALRTRVRATVTDRKPGPQDYRDAAKFLREEKFKAGGTEVMASTATNAQIAAGVWTVPTGEPGKFADIQANVVNEKRDQALAQFAAMGIPQEAVSERDIATQVYHIVTQENQANTAQVAATVEAQRKGHDALYSIFQNTLALTPGGDRTKAQQDALAKVTPEMARLYGLTMEDVQSMAGEFFGNPTDNALEQAWQKERALLVRDDPDYSSGSFMFWKRKREAFARWLFIGQERARQENAAKFPNDPQFRYENVWTGHKTAEQAAADDVLRNILNGTASPLTPGGATGLEGTKRAQRVEIK